MFNILPNLVLILSLTQHLMMNGVVFLSNSKTCNVIVYIIHFNIQILMNTLLFISRRWKYYLLLPPYSETNSLQWSVFPCPNGSLCKQVLLLYTKTKSYRNIHHNISIYVAIIFTQHRLFIVKVPHIQHTRISVCTI